MACKFSVRKAISNPAVIREAVNELLRRMRSPDQSVQLAAAKSLLVLTILHVRLNFTPKS